MEQCPQLATHANMRSMTSDGHAITRLQRLLASGRGTSEQIRLLVSELPRRPDLELALAICLALLDREPAVYPLAAARWGSRFALERNLPLVDAQLALAALAVLPEDGGRAGAEALIDLADRSLGTSFVSDLSCGRSRASSPVDCALSDASRGISARG